MYHVNGGVRRGPFTSRDIHRAMKAMRLPASDCICDIGSCTSTERCAVAVRSKARWLAQSRPHTQHTKQNKNTKEKFESTKCVESVHKRVSGPRPPAGQCSNWSMKVTPCYCGIAALTFYSNHISYHNRIRCALCTGSDPILTNFALRPGALKVAPVFVLDLLRESLLFGNQ